MSTAGATAARMDRMYRCQRHVYDLTRRYYLLGRDRMIVGLPVPQGGAILELGCGTGRNLVALARLHPGCALFGVDASAVMLETARTNIARAGFADRIRLAHGLGETVDRATMFGRDRPFDAIVISYALSMIPAWRQVVEAALGQLAPGGTLAIVDFWDQRGLPAWSGRLLRRWLALFDVQPRPDLPDFVRSLAVRYGGRASIEPVLRRYALHLTYTAPVAR